MEKKKSLKLEVKTLETRLAPGACYDMHMSNYAGNEEVGEQTWNAYWDRMGANEGGNSAPAGTPVIGIN